MSARQRPFYRSVADGLLFLIVLTVVLAVAQRFGGFDFDSRTTHVIDGDSLRVGATEIRLRGIDAPEFLQTCRDKHGTEYQCGKQAADVLRQLIGAGNISCRSFETDRYERSVAVCKNGGLELNAEMVRLGWAVNYDFSYAQLEGEARRAKRGIWAGSFEMPQDYRQRTRKMLGNTGDANGAAGQD